MRVRLAMVADDLVEAVRRIAPGSLKHVDELIVPGPASLRPRVLDVIRANGAEVRGLTAEDGRLDALYRDLVATSEKPS
jgi:Cu-processing system ATP-binding protein